jgi:SWIM zinc finger
MEIDMIVTVKNTMYGQTKQFTYEGEEVSVPNWVDYPAIALATGTRQFPVRIIAREHIVKIDGDAIEQKVSIPTANRQFQVTGSNGNTYVVTVDGAYKSCTCSGFQFRRNCRHIVEVQ